MADKQMGAPVDVSVDSPTEVRVDGHRIISFSAHLGEAYGHGPGEGLLIWPLSHEQVEWLLDRAPRLLREPEAVGA